VEARTTIRREFVSNRTHPHPVLRATLASPPARAHGARAFSGTRAGGSQTRRFTPRTGARGDSIHGTFAQSAASNRSVSTRLLALLLLLPWATAVAGAVDERVLRANDTELRIAVVGVEDHARVELLHRWAAEAARATLTASGRFPLKSARARIVQRPGRSSEAVPWGQTSRRGEAAVLLYVRPDATLDELRADWTAVHEFSHLYHPYLGNDGRWLAEGLASYYQNVLRARAGLLRPGEAWQRLEDGFARGRRATEDVPLAGIGRGRGATMRIYWAGAAYWLDADLALRKRGSSLDAVLDRHARCCLRGSASMTPVEFVAALDEAGGDGVFSRLYRDYSASREFPSQQAAYTTLGIEANGGSLQFSSRPQAAGLRAAIMGPEVRSAGGD
jgi:hypothetical protein